MATLRRARDRSKDRNVGRMDRDPDQNPFTRTGFVLSAALVGLVFMAALAVIVDYNVRGPGQKQNYMNPSAAPRGPGPSGPRATPYPDVPSSAISTAGPSNGSCPSLDAKDQAIPATAPAGISWEMFRSVLLPSSDIGGPAVEDDGISRCYADTPTGALVAAAQITTRYVLSAGWEAVTRAQVAEGPGRDAYIDQRLAEEDVNGPAGAPEPGEATQIAGFRFLDYNPTAAVLQLLRRSQNGGLVATTHTMVWSGGDWKLRMETDGSDSSTVQRVTSLSGFTMWAAS
ncbi:hypothetical protein GCM10023205_84800 [Yinghuangia aomiensis]|uniref:DUF8175 domain-containing protein n=1 Tax=Yinghuangia aomiensis TaxID=676205 RepID=A0ABP9IHI7_9ACTN